MLKRGIFAILLPALAAVGLVTMSGTRFGASGQPVSDSPIKPLKRDAVPVDKGGVAVPSLDDMNQCAGTTQQYRLQPTGYVPPKPDARSEKGRKLFDRRTCAACHATDGKGGTLGPPLDGIGGHRGREFLVARLLDPASQMRDFPDLFGGRPNIMPHPDVNRREAEQLVSYLLTLPEPEGGFLVTVHPRIDVSGAPAADKLAKPAAASAASEKGRELFVELKCAACHSVDGSARWFGPDLAGIGQRRSPQSIDMILQGMVPSEVMRTQSTQLTEAQVRSITAYLLTLAPTTTEKPPTTTAP